jgi:threonine dehydrogenase-like Zn-dependent dehydrogenase
VLVKVRSTNICGTDVRIVSGRKTRRFAWFNRWGMMCAVTIAAVGEGVTTMAVGERVGLLSGLVRECAYA